MTNTTRWIGFFAFFCFAIGQAATYAAGNGGQGHGFLAVVLMMAGVGILIAGDDK